MKWFVVAVGLLMVMPLTVGAQDYVIPDPALSPEDVVEIQLSSLQHNDTPVADAGITQTWVFAHPNNKSVTGPLERFAAMIKSSSYAQLINHKSHILQPISQTENDAMVAVIITTGTGRQIGYRWELSKVIDGALEGSWMTTSVSAPVLVQDSI